MVFSCVLSCRLKGTCPPTQILGLDQPRPNPATAAAGRACSGSSCGPRGPSGDFFSGRDLDQIFQWDFPCHGTINKQFETGWKFQVRKLPEMPA